MQDIRNDTESAVPGERGTITQLPPEAPAGALRAASYHQKALELKERFPGAIIVPGDESLGDHLRHHTWSQSDILDAFPWKVKLFRRTAGQSLPYILNTEHVREAYPEHFENLDNEHKNAVKLYDPEDLMLWFRNNLVSKVQTVLVPLTLFADRPDEMRDAFRRVRDGYLAKSYAAKTRLQLQERRLSLWPEILFHVKRSLRDEVGKFHEDASARAKEQGVVPTRAKFPEYEVRLPADKMPVFFEKKDIGRTRNYDSEEVSYSSYKFFGWAEHSFREGVDPGESTRKKAYTQGLWIGGDDCLRDYEEGLLELMTAERFVRVFGESALKEADWRFPRDLCSWAKDDASFGPGFPPKELSVLLGINRVAPKER